MSSGTPGRNPRLAASIVSRDSSHPASRWVTLAPGGGSCTVHVRTVEQGGEVGTWPQLKPYPLPPGPYHLPGSQQALALTSRPLGARASCLHLCSDRTSALHTARSLGLRPQDSAHGALDPGHTPPPTPTAPLAARSLGPSHPSPPFPTWLPLSLLRLGFLPSPPGSLPC